MRRARVLFIRESIMSPHPSSSTRRRAVALSFTVLALLPPGAFAQSDTLDQILDDSAPAPAPDDKNVITKSVPAPQPTAPAPATEPTADGKRVSAKPAVPTQQPTAQDDAVLSNILVIGKRLEQARNSLSPTTGSSQYAFDDKSLKSLPEGRNTPFNQVLLQAPSVVNDSQGQLHVRGDHGDLQYRIDGVILPEGISGFGQVLDTRFADSIKLLTGALPAQFGERTAGVIDVKTRDNLNGGDISLYGGSHATFNPSFDYGLTTDQGSTAFVSGSYLRSKLGTEAPTPAYNPVHDGTEQGKGFGFFAMNLSDTMRLSVMAGTAYNRFDIPNTPGQTPDPAYVSAAGGAPAPSSANLDEQQFERNDFGILALQGVLPNDGGWQVAAFNRVSSVIYEPDPAGGDLLYNGVSASVKRKATTYGLQGDVSIPLGDAHTLRAGLIATTEDDRSDDTATVFPVDADGNPNGPPQTLVDDNPKNGSTLTAVYLQDEWNISDSLTLNYGVRFDQLHAYVSSNQLSSRLGLVWYIDPKTTFHAGYARYFTPPPNELVASSSINKFDGTTNQPPSDRNDPVKPERAHYFDIGLTRQISDSYDVGVDSYYKYARDLLDEGQFGQALIYTPFNYARGHVYGIELTNSFHRGNWNAYVNVARSMAKATQVDSGQFNFDPTDLAYIQSHYVFLDHTQLWTASAGASYEWRGTTGTIDGIYQDGLRNDGDGSIPNGGKQPPYVVLNLALAHSFTLGSAGPLDVRLSVVNLLDRTYQIHDGTGIGVGAAQYGARRGVFLGLSKSI